MLIRSCRRLRRSFLLVSSVALTALGAYPQAARGGGYESGANGTEALGRGGAFTAKADSPLALEYNVAGFGQQRGTRMLFDNNLFFSQLSFQRAGGDAAGPYAEVSDHATQPFYAPYFGLSTDFGFFNRWTFAIGAFGPSSIGRRSYGVFASTGPGRGAASRYDVVATDLLIVQPTFAVAVHPHRVIDIGLSVQQVSAVLNLSSATYVPQSLSPQFPMSSVCAKQAEVAGCDAFTRVQVRSFDNWALQLGLLVHPVAGLHIGANVRSAVNLGFKAIEARGTVSAAEPPYLTGLGLALGESAATSRMDAMFTTWLPWVLRAGVRYAFLKAGRELADVELDVVYEAWGHSDGGDNQLTLLSPPALVNQGMPVSLRLVHNYRDTFSIRAGGSFTQPLGSAAALSLRLGAHYDSSATRNADTRIDFDTLDKVGGTLGLGVTVRGLGISLAYAYLHSLPRTVTDGALLPIDGLSGQPLSINGQPAAAINNGDYSGRSHILSIGLSFLFDEIARGPGWLQRRFRHSS